MQTPRSLRCKEVMPSQASQLPQRIDHECHERPVHQHLQIQRRHLRRLWPQQIRAWKKLDKADKRTVLAEAELRLLALGATGRRKSK